MRLLRKQFLVALLALTAASVSSVYAQDDSYFTPYKSIDLRLPSVPLIMNDPFISFWSPYDKLTDGTTRHWSDLEKPMDGLLRVDGTVYRWMGVQDVEVLGDPLLPMTADASWSAKAYIGTLTGNDWFESDFDDSSWETMKGAFGCPYGKYDNGTKECTDDWHTNVGTEWFETGTNVYIRRHLTLTAEDLEKDLYVKYSHDDYFYLYINGHLVVSTGYTWVANETKQITDAYKRYLVEGDNLVAVRCFNQAGGAYCDFGIYQNLKTNNPTEKTATQNSVDVLACNTYYNFTCGPVDLDVVFTAPMIIDDLESISVPINYVSYRAVSNDGQEHDVQFYYAFTPLMTVLDETSGANSRTTTQNGVKYVYTGAKTQNILGRTGDLVPIDWGYMYMPAVSGGDVCVSYYNNAEAEFAADGVISTVKTGSLQSTDERDYPVLAFVNDLGTSTSASGYMMLGYDERYDIQYNYTNYKGYWARNGKTIYEAFDEMSSKYDYNMLRSREMDKIIYEDAYNATNSVKYAELLSGTYRHCLAAHKLFEDNEGDILYFSKENNSGGFVNTVDLTYPSCPIFLVYNPVLEKGMITSSLDYCYSGRWPYNFANHDLGLYPHANYNLYGDPNANNGSTMPLEESANIIALAAFITRLDGDLDYIRKYWDVLTSWNQYLIDNGKEPGDQLCTDDFKGSSTRNANLAVKAIMGIASFAELCKMLGYDDLYEQHMATAKEYAHYWVDMDKASDHYLMEFESSSSTWSLKYNMLWDKLWEWNIFNDDYTGDVMAVEIPYYKTKCESWGLPLDGRDKTAKSDWNAWVAAMTDNETDFNYIMDREWKFANECVSRWPLSDWHWTDSPDVRGFRGRSVIGGFWAKVLMEKTRGNLPESGSGIQSAPASSSTDGQPIRYNLRGQRINAPEKGINIVKYPSGVVRKELVK